MLYTLIHQLALIRSHKQQASLRHQFSIHHMSSRGILIMYKGYIFASSSADSFYIELEMNLTLCGMYCGLLGASSSVVVEALCYKLEGCGIAS
jgi:hypothetical protein